jgi:hypothetical protein
MRTNRSIAWNVISIFQLATRFEIDAAKEHAKTGIDQLRCVQDQPVQLLHLARVHGVEEWFEAAFRQLLLLPISCFSKEGKNTLGAETLLAFASLLDVLIETPSVSWENYWYPWNGQLSELEYWGPPPSPAETHLAKQLGIPPQPTLQVITDEAPLRKFRLQLISGEVKLPVSLCSFIYPILFFHLL